MKTMIPTFSGVFPAFPRPAPVPDVKAIETAGERGRIEHALETMTSRTSSTIRPKKAA